MTQHEAHSSAHKPAARDATTDLVAAASTVVATAERLGPRLTEHGFGCPFNMGGVCTCGITDYHAAMQALAAAIKPLVPQNGG